MNLQEQISRIKGVMGLLTEDEKSFQEPVIYIEKDENSFVFMKNTFYVWLYDIPDAEQKMRDREIIPVFFPPVVPYHLQNSRNVPLTRVWQKSYLKDYPGSEHLLGVIQGHYDEENKKAIIYMMTVNKESRRQGINSYMIKKLREKLNLSQDQIVFDDPTPQGEKFMNAKTYE